ncbi:MAG: LON peptidase substrate-binding domain-containing protein [Rhodospirillaceae bacterium]|nr:LON peptidase substrate-binding domain-containing protein [Rhodospirillaceae bacterium]
MFSPISTKFEDLPQHIPVFPLTGALLLPGGRLPLNLFEPRYLRMALDSLAAGRMIGMIQPNYDAVGHENRPYDELNDGYEDGSEATLDLQGDDEVQLYKTGCVGRIVYFEETDDGRLLIALRGLTRFRMLEESERLKGYRRVRADYSSFRQDMEPREDFDLDRDMLFETLQPYIDAQGMRLKVDIIKGLSDHTLVSSLCMICPFDPREKQALLEIETVEERADMLLALLQMGVFEAGASEGPSQ